MNPLFSKFFDFTDDPDIIIDKATGERISRKEGN